MSKLHCDIVSELDGKLTNVIMLVKEIQLKYKDIESEQNESMQNSKCNTHEANPQDVEVMESKDVFSNKSGIEQELRDIVEFLEQCEKEENPDEYMNKVIAGVEEFDSKTGIVNSRVKNIGNGI